MLYHLIQNIKAKTLSRIKIGNGNGLEISHIGSFVFQAENSKFLVNDILHVPKITKKLFFVQRFTQDNRVVFEFQPSYCSVKDTKSGQELIRGKAKDGLHFIDSFSSSSNKTAYIGERVDLILGIVGLDMRV